MSSSFNFSTPKRSKQIMLNLNTSIEHSEESYHTPEKKIKNYDYLNASPKKQYNSKYYDAESTGYEDKYLTTAKKEQRDFMDLKSVQKQLDFSNVIGSYQILDNQDGGINIADFETKYNIKAYDDQYPDNQSHTTFQGQYSLEDIPVDVNMEDFCCDTSSQDTIPVQVENQQNQKKQYKVLKLR